MSDPIENNQEKKEAEPDKSSTEKDKREKANKSRVPIAAFSSFPKKVRSFISAHQKKFKLSTILTQGQEQQELPLKPIPNRFPCLKQLKYLPRFLSPKEKLLTSTLLGVIFLNLVFIGARFYINHLEIVPASGGEYIEAIVGSPRLINPIIGITADVDKDLTRLIYSGLLKYNKEHKLVPDIASNYAILKDQKTYTFYLKKNVFWHDDQPLTADDIIFTVETIQNPAYKSPLLVSFRGVIIEKVDDYTIKFNLEQPFAPFLSVLTFGILPKHIWENIPIEQFALATYNIKPVGSGPYKFKSLAKNQTGEVRIYTLEANKRYYEPSPFIKTITFKFFASVEEAESALLAKQVDGINYLPKELKDKVNADPHIIFVSSVLPQYTAVFFNQNKNEFFKIKNVRHALAYSINKEKILKDALNQEGEIISGPILPGSVGFNPEIRKYEFDLEKAKKIINQAGFITITADEYRTLAEKNKKDETSSSAANNIASQATSTNGESSQKTYLKKGNNILDITLTTVDQPELQKVAEIIKKTWQQIGVKVNLNIIPSAKIKTAIQERDYEAFLYGVITGFDPDPYPFWHSSQNQAPGLNLAIFSNKEVDKVLEEARQTNNEKIRQDKYVHFQNILIEELPAIFLYSPTYTYAINSKVKGFNITRITQPADRFANIEDWYIKTKRVIRW